MKWLPRIAYNNSGVITINFTLPQKWWTPDEGAGMGDEDISGSGIPVSYWVRWDHGVRIGLRFTDAERPTIMAWLEWSMKNKGIAFTFRFDQSVATDLSMYLEAPKTGERISPTRNSQDPSVWELDVTLRSSNSTRIHQAIA